MRAVGFRSHGPLGRVAVPDDWPEPVAGSGKMIVAVRAVSLNVFDAMVLRGHRRTQDAAADDLRRRPCRGGRRPRPRHRGSGLAERLGDLDAQRVPGQVVTVP
jgi:hypothetical protein